ncbi:DUF2381 family protein [Pyxidicoccus trucidator]|uniref:DUF2381 family protein n=1 Tax=Pyxidicoccus trucidator TaxID=2709662 RepID=UPI0013DCDA08|nr:DUF2381 family protein [Pyxidicoccus trucidator]
MPVHPVFLLALALALGVGATAAAQPQRFPPEAGLRRIELRAVAADAEPEIHISPGISTVLTFDGRPTGEPVGRLQVALERSADFQRLELGESVLRLVPSDELKTGDQVRLTVRFADGAAPPVATFVLVVREAHADRLVEVYREPRPVESYQQEVREAWEAVRQCHEELTRAQATPGGLTGLTALRVSAVLADNGVVARKIPAVAFRLRSGALMANQVRTYSARRRVLVELSLRFSQPGEPWTAKDASLTRSRGERLKVVSVWQEFPVTTVDSSWVLVEAESDASLSPDAWTLRLSEEGNRRALVVDGISFAPVAQSHEGE